MYYYIKNTLEKTNKLDFKGKGGKFVAVLTSMEWLENRERFDMGIEMDIDFSAVHTTKAEVNYDSLTGTFSVPNRENISAPATNFAFALDEKGIVFIDDSGFVNKTINIIISTKKWAMPSLERFIFDFLEQIVSHDQQFLIPYYGHIFGTAVFHELPVDFHEHDVALLGVALGNHRILGKYYLTARISCKSLTKSPVQGHGFKEKSSSVDKQNLFIAPVLLVPCDVADAACYSASFYFHFYLYAFWRCRVLRELFFQFCKSYAEFGIIELCQCDKVSHGKPY